MSADDPRVRTLEAQVRACDRGGLARAITLVESTLAEDRVRAAALLRLLHPQTGGAVRLGISGVPGVGKSTFIEALGLHLVAQGRRVAVLAVDPTSARSGGSILGDKTRMQQLAHHPDAFIRPSPTQGSLGGVASSTRESLLLCEAAGFDVILVETVGVGQSEIMVSEMVDSFLVLMLANAGDELQGIKRGILEMVDVLVINKADGPQAAAAKLAAADYKRALHLMPPSTPDWTVPVQTCSALEKTGVEAVWEAVEAHRAHLVGAALLETRRQAQAEKSLHRILEIELGRMLRANASVAAELAAQLDAVRSGQTTPRMAAIRVLEAFNGPRSG